jgi:hypothetical protein
MKALLIGPQQAKQVIDRTWMDYIKPMTFAGHRLVLEVKEATRSTAQNNLMWELLGQISEQVVWHGQKLQPEEWKDALTASLRGQKVIPGISGGFVVLGQRTSKMTVAEMSEMIELCYAFGVEKDVKFKAEEYA